MAGYYNPLCRLSNNIDAYFYHRLEEKDFKKKIFWLNRLQKYQKAKPSQS